VQTIHAFCTRLLHQFPFEANVAARFTVLDEPSTAQLLNQLTLDVLLQAAAEPEGPLGKALATAIVVAADITFKEVIGDAIKARDAIGAWIANAGGIDQAIAQLSETFGIAPDDSLEQVEQEFFSASLIPEGEWPVLIEILSQGAKSDKNNIDAFTAARAASGRDRIDQYLRIFCTAELSPRKSLLTGALADRYPEWLGRLLAEQERICTLLERERALNARERTRALVTIAKEVIDRYQMEKERRALLDYDDLIDRTLALFKIISAAWVLYKLDLGIDHILIDEAQDTSRKQWEIIKAIAAEFMPGGSRPNTRRTLFAVGDEKQSIFSFQGAAPEVFDVMRRLFAPQFVLRPIWAGNSCAFTTRSVPAPRCSARSIRCSAGAKSTKASPPTWPEFQNTNRCPTLRLVSSSCGRWSNRPRKKKSRAGMRPSTRRAKKARACCWRKKLPSM
jgi:ATP-dependent helicase/nuclease subunit A